MKIIGGNEKGSLVPKVLPKKRIGSNGVNLGLHSHKVVKKRYNGKNGSLSINFLRSFLSFTHISELDEQSKF